MEQQQEETATIVQVAVDEGGKIEVMGEMTEMSKPEEVEVEAVNSKPNSKTDTNTNTVEEEEEAEEEDEDEPVPKILMMGQARESKKRSSDVIVLGKEETIDFNDMHLPENILKGLTLCRYEKPTPIQLNAIPLGKLKKDLLLQAKSGTGKTCVFAVNVLQQVVITDQFLQALVISPCREVSTQIVDVIKSIGTYIQGLKVKLFIGGTDLKQSSRRSKKCHIAVGTPGRVAHLVKDKEMDLSRVKVFAMDEADKLMDTVFFQDVSVILNALPEKRQIISTSATYSDVVLSFLEKFMNNPETIRLDVDNLSLAAVDQYAVNVVSIIGKPSRPPKSEREKQKHTRMCKLTTKVEHSVDAVFQVKMECLKEILNRVNYTQVVVFSNYILRAESIFDQLSALKLDVSLLSSGQKQNERTASFRGLQQGQYRILVATDLAARGIDVEGIDMIINFDLPIDSPTYIHRVGRTGRFGSFGKALSLCCLDSDMMKLQEHQEAFKFNLFLVESAEELNVIDAHSKKSKQSVLKYSETKSLRQSLTLNDQEMSKWKLDIADSKCPKKRIRMFASTNLRTGVTPESIQDIIARAEGDFQALCIEKSRPVKDTENAENPTEEQESEESECSSSFKDCDVESIHGSDVEYNSAEELM